MVLFNTRWPDEDGNYRSDFQDVAESYATRRGIPMEHLLGLAVTEGQGQPGDLSYPEFFRRILVPTRQRLAALTGRRALIHYIVTCYGMPLVINTNLEGKQNEHLIWQPTDYDARNCALTGWLVNLEENFEAGFDRVTGKPGPRGGASGGKPLGAILGDITLPWVHDAFVRPDQSGSFETLRMASPAWPGASAQPSSRGSFKW